MRKTWIALAVTGWLTAGVLWYGGHVVTKERDHITNTAETLQLELAVCMKDDTQQTDLNQTLTIEMGICKAQVVQLLD